MCKPNFISRNQAHSGTFVSSNIISSRLILVSALVLIFACEDPNRGGPGPDPPALWTRTYGGSGWDEAYSVQQTTDGGFIVAGVTQSLGMDERNMFLIRVSPESQ